MALSSRGKKAIQPALSYFAKQIEGSSRVHSDSAPDGYVLLAVAENRLNYHQAAAKLATCRQLEPSTGAYANMCGRDRFRNAFSKVMNETVLRTHRVDPDGLVVGSGCGGVINNLGFLMMEEGDAVLLPTPTYGALYNDFSVLANARIVDVPTEATGYRLTVEALEQAYEASTAAGSIPRVLFLINPNNPMGIVYSPEDMHSYIAFARERGMHVIVDEIYANSVWSSDQDYSDGVQASGAGGQSPVPPFVSVCDLLEDKGGLGDDVHVLWGMSKDFAMSGYRVGILYSRNNELLTALSNINYFTSVSNDTQDALARLCEDVEWCKEFFATNHECLRKNCRIVTSALDKAGIPYLPARAGMFVWADLRELLGAQQGKGRPGHRHLVYGRAVPGVVSDGRAVDFSAERNLVDRLWNDCGLLLTPGQACHAAAPGFFRCCFAWMPPDSVQEGMNRLVRMVEKVRA